MRSPSKLHNMSDFDPDGFYWNPLAYPRWVRWRLENGKKVPKRPDGFTNAKNNDPSTWVSRARVEQYDKTGFMLGYVEEVGEFICGVDSDKCVSDREIAFPAVKQIVARFATYTKFSTSGRGLHVMFTMSPADVEWARQKYGINYRKVVIPKNDEHVEVAIDFDHRLYVHTDDVIETRWRRATRADIEWLFSLREEKSEPDDTESGYAIRFFMRCIRKRMDKDEAVKAILADNGRTGHWAKTKGVEENYREINRTWEEAEKFIAEGPARDRPGSLNGRLASEIKPLRLKFMWYPISPKVA
jgi:hypothetical protein